VHSKFPVDITYLAKRDDAQHAETLQKATPVVPGANQSTKTREIPFQSRTDRALGYRESERYPGARTETMNGIGCSGKNI